MRPRRIAATLVGLAAAATGLNAALRRRRRRRGDPRVFVLEYHDVSGGKEFEGTISAERFRRHLRYLRRHYRIETFVRAAARLAQPDRLDEDVVALTFDDGYAGNARHAWPVLAAEGVPATIYLTTGFLDGGELWFDFARRALTAATSPAAELPPDAVARLGSAFGTWPPDGIEAAMNHLKTLVPEQRDTILSVLREAGLDLPAAAEPLTWDDAKRLQAAGIELGAHTVTHPVLPTLPRGRQEEEIVRSRDRIAEATGTAPETFSYPNGDFDADSVDVVREAGFSAACTTFKGSNRPGADLLRLRRIGVGSDPVFLLAARLSGLFDEEMRRFRRPSS